MKVISARNVHQALPNAMRALQAEGVEKPSRNGPVLKFDTPVATMYQRPTERVMFWPQRDANPFFHLFESLWMLAGRRDVEYVAQFVERMRSYSDDGEVFWGAYGYRWRHWFDKDQIQMIIEGFRKDPNDRRLVLSMWDGHNDLGRQGKDLPCNLQALFSINALGSLDMTVTNRSNDIVWGAYGANAVHFSVLQEYIATALGIPVGRYWQMSANFHAYLDTLGSVADLGSISALDIVKSDPYAWDGAGDIEVKPFPLITTSMESWDRDLHMFLADPFALGFQDPFFKKVAVPMMRTIKVYKGGDAVLKYDEALREAQSIQATDWQRAAVEWIQRRKAKFVRANDNGVAYE